MHTSSSQITINASPEAVWSALTQPELVKQWQYGSDLITDWQVGNSIKFHSEWQGQVYEQWGKVLEVERPTHIKYSLFAPRPGLEDIPENYFNMIYSLSDKNGKTELTFTQEDPRERLDGQADDENEDTDGNPILIALKQLVEATI